MSFQSRASELVSDTHPVFVCPKLNGDKPGFELELWVCVRLLVAVSSAVIVHQKPLLSSHVSIHEWHHQKQPVYMMCSGVVTSAEAELSHTGRDKSFVLCTKRCVLADRSDL